MGADVGGNRRRRTLHWDITCGNGLSTTGETSDPGAPNAGPGNAVRILYDGRATMVRVRFYPGPQLTVLVMPWVEHEGDRVGLVDVAGHYGNVPGMISGGVALGSRAIRGDDDLWIYDVDVPVHAGDRMGVAWRNGDAVNAHVIMVDVLLSLGGV